MLTQILITRPAPSAADTAATLNAAGYRTLVAPILDALPLPVETLALQQGDQLVVTSPQAARILADWPQLHSYPVIAVGDRTASLLRESGFQKVVSVDGDAVAIAKYVQQHFSTPQNFHLLCAPTTGQWLDTTLTEAGHKVRRQPVYLIEPVAELPAAAQAAIDYQRVSHVLFYSAFTARTFMDLAAKANLIGNLATITACCLSSAVAAVVAGAGWRDVLTATAPNSTALQQLLPAVDYQNDRRADHHR